MQVFIKEIEPGERLRQEMGDIGGLMNSIKEHGLLHPIVIAEPTEATNGKYRLVAGGRRLEACKQLNMEVIDAKNIRNISTRELRIIELEENIRRKDLTEYEKSRDLVDLINVTKEVVREEHAQELITDSVKNSVGRPETKTAIPKIAERIGVPQATLYDAQNHVAAVDKYPDLVDFPKHKAIETAKVLDKTPDKNEQDEYLQKLIRENDKKIDRDYSISNKVKKLIDSGYGESVSDDELDLYLHHYPKPIEEHLERLNATIKTFQKIKEQLENRKKIRRVT